MKKKYISPDIKITLFSTADIITVSAPSGGSGDEITTASLEQAETPQVNDFNEYFN